MWCHGSETGSVESAPRTNWKTALQAVSARSRTLAIRFTVKRVSHLPARNFLVVPSHQSRAITSTCYWFFFWFFFFKLIVFIKRFYISLCSRTDSLCSCGVWFSVSDYLFQRGFGYPPKWCTYSSVWLLHGWCHVKLLTSLRVLCTPYIHVCQGTSFKATLVGCTRV